MYVCICSVRHEDMFIMCSEGSASLILVGFGYSKVVVSVQLNSASYVFQFDDFRPQCLSES